MRLSIWISWGVVAAWMGVIFYLSHQVAADSSELSSGITVFILDMIHAIFPNLELEQDVFSFFVRKAAHFTAYFVLGIVLFIALGYSGVYRVRRVVSAFVIAVIYAISDEVHQLFVPGRSGEVRDVLIDSAGALTGILFVGVVVWVLGKRKERLE